MSCIPPPLRVSEAAVVLIRQPDVGEWAYLCQWSETWRALHFIGGHREPGESFRECAVREVQEELWLSADEFTLPLEPTARLDYVAFSESAGVLTRYVMAVFPADLTSDAVRVVEVRPENAWVGPEDLRCGTTSDGQRVSPTVSLILGKLGRWPTA